jgi:beta-mannosidase
VNTELVSESGAPGRERLEMTDGWALIGTRPDACDGPQALPEHGWVAAPVPGTVAGALAAAEPGTDGQPAVAAWAGGEPDVDAHDWWYRVGFDAEPAADGEEVVLALDGIATVAEVYLNGHRILDSDSMFAAHELHVGALLNGRNELAICCRALTPRLKERRKPRARWRTKLVSEGNLRFFRTMLIGRAPGFAPGPAVAGPWRPVALERRRGLVLEAPRLRARIHGADGVLDCRAQLHALPGSELPAELAVSVTGHGAAWPGRLTVTPGRDGTAVASGTVIVPEPELWWPHTHGTPALYDVRIGGRDDPLYRARIGFRRLEAAVDLLADGPDLRINGARVFARGAVWTPLDQRAPHASPAHLRHVLEHVVGGGLNMLRIPGIGAYESEAFHDLCDELGILVWQDFMFANLDYPESDPDFMATVEREARAVLAALAPRPSLAMLCGGSEVAQQVAMLGLDPDLANGPLYGQLLPAMVGEAEVDAPYVPSAPWGGDLPFRTDRGVANYYGVGAYLRPLEDARRSEVRFAAECLAFANVPDEAALRALDAPGGRVVHDPSWKAGVPRDVGADWDFEDVRDHYLRLLFDADPVALRSVDPERYLEVSRAVSGEVMGEVFGEWRRPQSPCGGGLVLWLKDLRPGAGWGVLDHRGEPKVAYHHLRRLLAPVAVWTIDEGLGGVVAHIANDRPQPLAARLRVALHTDFSRLVGEAVEEVELPGRSHLTRNVEAMLGRFVDAAWAYRFGPPAQDLITVSLERDPGGVAHELISQAFRFPAGRPPGTMSADELGLQASLVQAPGAGPALRVTSTRFAYGVRASVPGFVAADDAFGIEPGHERLIALSAAPDGAPGEAGALTALNLAGRIRLRFAG